MEAVARMAECDNTGHVYSKILLLATDYTSTPYERLPIKTKMDNGYK
jgi:hypothetical protein